MTLQERANAMRESPKQKWALIVLLFAVLMILLFWWYESRFVSTDDAYINANLIEITPQVPGAIVSLSIVNNQMVKAGAALFTIDPAPYQLAADKAAAQLKMAEESVSEDAALVAANEANVAVQMAKLAHAQVSAARILTLVKEHGLPEQSRDDALADLNTAKATLVLAKAQLQEAQLKLTVTNTQVSVAKADVAEAKINLQYTNVVAPCAGQIANLTLRVGDVVSALAPQFSLIANNEYWLDANFEETDLSFIKVGQNADVQIDIYGAQHFKGIVESIGGGSGQAFSLLPPQNATGNWVKITQRVPVRIRILNPPEIMPIGTSARVKINTQQMLSVEPHVVS